MIRQRLQRDLPGSVLNFRQRQAGSSATRLALVMGVLGALVLLAALYLLRERTHRPLPPLPSQTPRQTRGEEMQAADDMASRIISSLSLSGEHITLEQFPRKDDELTWNESVITVTLPPETSLHQVEHVNAGARELFAPAGLRAHAAYDSDTCLRITIRAGEHVTHRLVFHLAPPPLPPETLKPQEPAYRVALVIDDLGENYRVFQELDGLEVPITYAILPFRTYSAKIADAIHANGSGEIILHLPLEPWNSGNHAINRGTLLTGMDRPHLLEQLERNIGAVPHLSGVSSHMGSKFTEDSEKMAWLLEALKEKGLYFLDSRTSRKTVAYSLAGKMMLKAAQRDLFLDNSRDQGSIEMQLRKILPLAKKRGGSLVVIGHPHPHTISALKQYLPLLRKQGVAFVPLSELVR